MDRLRGEYRDREPVRTRAGMRLLEGIQLPDGSRVAPSVADIAAIEDEARMTSDLAERLRRQGADKDLVEFTDRHTPRWSQVELERTQLRAFLLGMCATWAIVALFVAGIGR